MKYKELIKIKYILAIAILLLSISLPTFSQTTLTLEKTLEIAAVNSPSVKQSKLNLEGRQAALDAQNAALKSKFALSVSPFDYSKTRSFNDLFSIWNTTTSIQSGGRFSVVQPIVYTDGTLSLINDFRWQKSTSEFQGDTTVTSFYNSFYVEFNQPLFTYNRNKLNLRSLELDLENAQLRYAIDKLTIEQSVTQSFYNVHSAQKDLIIAEEELENQKKSYEIIKNKVNAGLSAREELIQAELNLASSQATYYNQQVNLENSKDRLKLLIGMPIIEDIIVLADITIDSVEVDLDKAVDFALQNRMELRQLEINIQNAYMNLTREKATNEFRGNLALSVGLSGDNEELPHIFDEPTNSPRVGIEFQIPLYDWGERKSRIKVAETNIESVTISLEEERKNIVFNIRQLYRNLHNLFLQIKIQEKNIENAQLTYEINLERYRNGDLTSMDLNLYQNQLSQNKQALTNAIIAYKLELLNLKIQSLWDFENNKAVIETITQ